MGEEAAEPGLDEMDAGRFQRLQESRGESERNAVAHPNLAPASSFESQNPRASDARSFDAFEQAALRRVVRNVFARVHVTVAHAMLQRDAPLPPGLARGRARHR